MHAVLTEPGNVGILTGPAFIDALKLRLEIGADGLTVQGVGNYSGSFEEYLEGGSPEAIAWIYVT